MTIFECSRCNVLAYSATPWADFTCEACGATSSRKLDAATFDAARAAPRSAGRGDHCAALHHGPEQAGGFVAPFDVYLEGFEPAEALARVLEVEDASECPLRVVGAPSPGFAALCLYDAEHLPEAYLQVKHAMHPLVDDGHGLRRNPDFAFGT